MQLSVQKDIQLLQLDRGYSDTLFGKMNVAATGTGFAVAPEGVRVMGVPVDTKGDR